MASTAHILHILAVIYNPQIIPSIVQPIAIYVIYQFISFKASS
jgi:hypothetical protein